MNVEARNELMEVLTEISRISPEIRLGQLVCWLTDLTDTKYTTSPVSDIEDEELLPAAKRHLALLRTRVAKPQDADGSVRLTSASDPLLERV